MPQHESLRILHTACWQELARAADARDHEWHTMVLATSDGAEPDARTVVLRGVDRARGELLFYSDARSRKVAQMARQPRACLVAWSPRLQWQLRLRVDLRPDLGGREASSHWARLHGITGRSDFLADPTAACPQLPLEPSRAPLDHFAVITAQVRRMEWLELHASGHRAAVLSDDVLQWVDA